MALVTELDLPFFDYTDESLRGAAYHSRMRELAGQGWLAGWALGSIVLDHEAGELFLRSRATTFPGQKLAELFQVEPGPLRDEIDRNILHLHGADHRRLRSLVAPAFSPRAAERWRPVMRGFVEDLFDAVAADGGCEAVEALCKPYPSMTIAAVLGAPVADAGRLQHWSTWIQRQFDPPSLMRDRAEIERAVQETYEYVGALLAARRGDPRDDLVSQLLAAEEQGDRLGEQETVDLVLNVLAGGVDTTQSQLAHGLRLFAEHPDQWQRLRAEPALIPGAVEEVLRHEPITPFTSRICLEDVTVRDVTFPKDSIVMVCAYTANHEDGEDFDVTREPGRRPLTFGAGVHYCLGANLARAELEEAFRVLTARVPRLELDGEPEYGTIQGIYGLDRLPLRWEATG
jgi:cytochrome P450